MIGKTYGTDVYYEDDGFIRYRLYGSCALDDADGGGVLSPQKITEKITEKITKK